MMEKREKYGNDYKSIEEIIEKQGDLSNHIKRIQLMVNCNKKEEFVKAANSKIASIKNKLTECQVLHVKCLQLLDQHRKVADEISDTKEYLSNVLDICHSHNIFDEFSELSMKSELSSEVSSSQEQTIDESLPVQYLKPFSNLGGSLSSNEFSPVVDYPFNSSNAQPIRAVRLLNQFYAIIPPLTTEEFNNVPVYMKGRLSMDYIQSFVDDFNTTLQVKYKLYSKLRSDVKKRIDMDLWKIYKSQDLPGNVKQYFITSDDIIRETARKIDKQFGNVICILRHVKRIKEDRSKGVHRYVVLN